MIEPRELFKNGTAERVDFQFKSIVLQMMQERLPEIPIEAYDKDFQVVEGKVGGGISEIKDFRVAFDDETTRAIRSKYTHDKKLKDRIDLDKRELYQKCQNDLGVLEAQYKAGELDQDAYLKEVAKTNQKYAEDYEYLSSRKYNKLVQRELVNKKEIVSLHEKQEQLVQKVSEIDIRMKKADQVKEIRRAWSDEQILENLTNRSPKFTRNELIRDIAKYRGLGWKQHGWQMPSFVITQTFSPCHVRPRTATAPMTNQPSHCVRWPSWSTRTWDSCEPWLITVWIRAGSRHSSKRLNDEAVLLSKQSRRNTSKTSSCLLV